MMQGHDGATWSEEGCRFPCARLCLCARVWARCTDERANILAAHTHTPQHIAPTEDASSPFLSVPTQQQDDALTTVCTHRQQRTPTAPHSREKTRMPQQISHMPRDGSESYGERCALDILLISSSGSDISSITSVSFET